MDDDEQILCAKDSLIFCSSSLNSYGDDPVVIRSKATTKPANNK